MKILYRYRESMSNCFTLVSFFLFFQWSAIAHGADFSPSGPGFLLDKYHALEKELEKGPGQARFHVESSVNQNASHIDIYGTVKYPFSIVQSELLTPAT